MDIALRPERGRHSRQNAALKYLAQDFRAPIDLLEQIYDIELSKLEAGARISTFIHVCALRNVREVLQQRDRKNPPPDESTGSGSAASHS
jgi:hypothetical protein